MSEDGKNVANTTGAKTRLDSWKEIASYLGREVRTVIRWEKERGLPVHRMPGPKRSAVYAWTDEIDEWREPVAISAAAEQTYAGLQAAAGETLQRPQAVTRPPAFRLVIGIAAAIVLCGLVAFEAVRSRKRRAHTGNPIEITSDGSEKGALLTGGKSLFFTSTSDGRTELMRLDSATSVPSIVPVGLRNFDLDDASPDGARVLVQEFNSTECNWPLWVVYANGQTPRRLAGLCVTGAAWSPDNKRLAYENGDGLFIAKADGTQARRVLERPVLRGRIRWAPDGKRIRVSSSRDSHSPEYIWEVTLSENAARARRLLPGWSEEPSDQEFDGCWAPDGRYFIFSAMHRGGQGLWGIREKDGALSWGEPTPFALATSPNGVGEPTLSADGKKIFARYTSPVRGELMRYEPKLGRFVGYPFLGPSAGHASFSLDGKQIAYVTLPKLDVMSINLDGTGGRVLANRGVLPQWSPNGMTVAFMGVGKTSLDPTKIFVVSAYGGAAVNPVHSPEWQGVPTWTSDGSSLIFGENGAKFPIPATCMLHRFDFATGQIVDLQGTRGLWTARACPTGKYLAALTHDNRSLVLYDLRTNAVTILLSLKDNPIGDNPVWSRDGKYLYIDSPQSPDAAVYRIQVPGGRWERVAGLKGVDRVHGDLGTWLGLTPDNLPLIMRNFQGQEIYSLDWIAP